MSKEPKPFRPKITRYLLAGKRVPKGTPGARRVRTHSDTWYVRLGGKPVSLGTTDRDVASEKLRQMRAKAKDEQLGIHGEEHDAAAKPLTEHVEDWKLSITNQGHEQGTADVASAHVLKLAELAGWTLIGHITYDTALAALAAVQNRLGLSARTRNHYSSSLRQFCRWLVRSRPRRLRENPVDGMPKVDEETDRRHPRRNPTAAELATLFGWLRDPHAATKTGRRVQLRAKMDGPTRALGYKVAMAAGLRASELRSLSRDSFRLDDQPPTVTVAAAYSKRRRLDTLPLPAWIVAELRAHFAAGGLCWGTFPRQHPGSVLEQDLEDAGIPQALPGPDGALEYFDMHSFRVHYCTGLANQPGISVKTLTTLCRHSTPTLTILVYAKARSADLIAAVESLPDPAPQPRGETRNLG